MSEEKELSHTQVWDDTELVDSWNEAYEEYKHYHSLHARGEMVEDVLRIEDEAVLNGHIDRTMDGDLDESMIHEAKLPERGVDEESRTRNYAVNDVPLDQDQLQGTVQSNSTHAVPVPSLISMPNALLSQGSDESLKNLMMSWYYAGYYTGFHEGQQKAFQNQTIPSQTLVDANQNTTEKLKAS